MRYYLIKYLLFPPLRIRNLASDKYNANEPWLKSALPSLLTSYETPN